MTVSWDVSGVCSGACVVSKKSLRLDGGPFLTEFGTMALEDLRVSGKDDFRDGDIVQVTDNQLDNRHSFHARENGLQR